ncbi:MAG: Mth938-like domain-containing protein [Candidatus Accumulibacter sp.]|uniref:Mth938-like domain-containing protein n=1 Tax=Accumulibacter sp. TaxID=2053492 RepID=UPI0019ECA67B|nr:Mth938-like domain-containing protein [Accumulibacter sp.]MBE2257439.1 Mth938-like domain-containing protein [Paracoccaceae bacterium]MCB1941460.1 Mth938-like domain-containing protein [Accumulibacter sp.]MCP5249964.1 Mth938-like domain-containing protein [Accumulibacter sp.]
MKLQLERPDGLNTFTAYGDGYVSVNGIRHHCNLAVLPELLIPNWTMATFETLSVDDFQRLAALDAEIVLLGTGQRLRFPSPDLLRPLVRAQKGLEVMDLPAACRTYNVLMGEGRKVAVGLLLV